MVLDFLPFSTFVFFCKYAATWYGDQVAAYIYYIVCRVPRFGVRFGTAVYVGGDYVSRVA